MSNNKCHSEETKKKISNSLLRNIPWNKGLTKKDPRVAKYVEKVSLKLRGKVPWNKGKKWDEEVINKISESRKGSVWTKEQKDRRSKMLKEKMFWSKENNPAWKGGIYKEQKYIEKYDFGFVESLKELVRKRDKYTCQICKISQRELKRKLSVHHIDYNKKNNSPENLITLCKYCHGKTNYNRITWKNTILNLITEKK